MAKRKISKCECCPFYAKNSETNKWECSKINRTYYSGSELRHYKGLCVFNFETMDDGSEKIVTRILDRWAKLNEKSEV